MEIKYRVWDLRLKIFLPINDSDGQFNPLWFQNQNKEKEQYVVQRFTGLLDKSGKEVYEGDILLYTPPYSEIAESGVSGEIDLVIWKDGAFKLKNGDYLYELIYTDNKLDDEIIGNIFENPELLCKHKNRSLAGKCPDCDDLSL